MDLLYITLNIFTTNYWFSSISSFVSFFYSPIPAHKRQSRENKGRPTKIK